MLTLRILQEALAEIIDDDACQDIVLDIGMPVRHKNVRYNSRVICYNRKIILIVRDFIR